MRMRVKGWAVAWMVAVMFTAQGAANEPPKVSVTVKPERVYIEGTGNDQRVVCSFELLNSGAQPTQITEIRMRAFDEHGTLLLWDKLDSNGSRRSIEVLGPRTLEPGKALTVFNPFGELRAAAAVTRLSYEIDLDGGADGGGTVSFDVRPTRYSQKSRLILPVAGAQVWAYEGPGFYSHHSRIDLADPFTREVLKLRSNSQRYALDLVVLNDSGAYAQGDENRKENWLGFGHPIVAPADGTVIEVENDQPDEMPFDETLAAKEPKAMVGNYVVIDHGNGEYSALAHFKRGSLSVKGGSRVRQGQVIGLMGRSGMGSGLIHVHYQLQTSTDLFDSEGLPAVFSGFRKAGGTTHESGRIEGGWVVVSEPFVQKGR